jgi:hypothetical protein
LWPQQDGGGPDKQKEKVMRNKRLRFFLLFAALVAVFSHDGKAQQLQNVTVQPDCVIVINFTTIGQTTPTAPNAGYNNMTGGCTTWTMQIAVSGFGGSPSVQLESAPNNAGVPGSWVTFAGGTIISPSPNNVNPIVTTTTGFLWEVGPAAWVRAHFLTGATGTGTITGLLLGYRVPTASSNGTSGGLAANVTIVSPLGPTALSGSLPIVNQSTCTSSAEVPLSGTGYTQIIAGSGATSIYVCNIGVTSASGGSPVVNTFSVAFGTCAGSPTEALNLAGVTGYTEQFAGSLIGASGAALCVSETTANRDKVYVTYAQR